MNKKIKYPIIILFALLYLYLEAIGTKYLPDYGFVWTLVSVLSCLFLYFYNDSIIIFSFINRKWNEWVKKPQVTWEISHAIQTNNEDCLITTNKKLIDYLKKKSKYTFTIQQDTENYLEYQIELPDIRKYSLSLNTIEDDIFELTIAYKCTLSYKQSRKELTAALNFFQTMTQHISISNEKNPNEFNELFNEPLYTLLLSFTGLNPFYGLMTKRIDQKEIESFSLEFTQQNCTIKITNNELTIVSSSQEVLDDVVSNYLALSDIT